ncbi:MAG: PQQ-binding-like beta-propeller repeat protein [Balneolia bacterium]|nr:PQQ-binding-like beta-propeller repeat protein [Balneolia bacterium]
MMLKNSFKKCVLLAASALLFAACGSSSVVSDVEPDWRSPAVDELSSVYVMNDTDRIYVIDGLSVLSIDGNTGEVDNRMNESFWNNIIRNSATQIGSFTFESARAMSSTYNMNPLHDSGIILLYDHRFDLETITALDPSSGGVLWTNDQLNFSMAKYSGLIQEAGARVGRALAGALGASHEAESAEEVREREVRFMSNLAMEIPGENKMFFKASNKLVLMDLSDGSSISEIEGFNGPGIAGLQLLDDGGYLVLSAGRDVSNLELSSSYSLARIDSEGSLVWMSEHSGRHTSDLMIFDNYVVVDGQPTEVFDLETGDKISENDIRRRSMFSNTLHHIVYHNDNLYVAADMYGQVGRVSESRLIRHHIPTGEITDFLETTRNTYFTDMQVHNGMLLVSGHGNAIHGRNSSGAIMALDPQTGEEIWISEEFSTAGNNYSGEPSVSQAVVSDDVIFVSDIGTLYKIDASSGETLAKVDHSALETGRMMGLYEIDDNIVLISRNGVTAFSKNDLSNIYTAKTESMNGYTINGSVAGLHNGSLRAVSVDLRDGKVGPHIRHGSVGLLSGPPNRYFGNLDGTVVFKGDGSRVITIDNDGRIHAHSLR